jgi:TFIIF-interacting CTD phosphatase-like protein
MIRTTLKTLESCTSQFTFTSRRRAQSSWIPPSKRRSVRYGSCSTSTQQSQSQRRPVVNGKILPFHVNDLKKTKHHVATSTSPSFSSQQRQNHNDNKNGSSNNTMKQHNKEPLRKYDSDLIVVLDMDECLIHSQFLQGGPGAKYAHQVQQRDGNGDKSLSSSSSSKSSVDTFNITLPDGERVLVHERPYLHQFLKEVSSKYETHIFTAAMEVYAKPVLDILDPHGDIFTNIYYRESCQLNSTVGAYVKNLGGLGLFCDDDSDSNNNESINNKRRLNRTVLVDNNPLR